MSRYVQLTGGLTTHLVDRDRSTSQLHHYNPASKKRDLTSSTSTSISIWLPPHSHSEGRPNVRFYRRDVLSRRRRHAAASRRKRSMESGPVPSVEAHSPPGATYLGRIARTRHVALGLVGLNRVLVEVVAAYTVAAVHGAEIAEALVETPVAAFPGRVRIIGPSPRYW